MKFEQCDSHDTLDFFSFSEAEILKKRNTGKFLILKNIVLSVIDSGRELCSLFFSFFHFLCKLIISTSLLSVDKKEIRGNISNLSSVTWAESESHAWWMQNLLSNIMYVSSQSLLFTCFQSFIYLFSVMYILSFGPIWYPKCWLRRHAVLRDWYTFFFL